MPGMRSNTGLAVSPGGQTASLTIGRNTLTWNQMARRFHIMPAYPTHRISYPGGILGPPPPQSKVSYNQKTDTWIFK